MRLIRISDPSRRMTAAIAPEYGGMAASLAISGRPVFRLDERILFLSPMLSGGMPVMFPFPSKTKDDCYRVGSSTYHMPFHGLVKNDSFAVREVSDDRIVLWIDNSESRKKANYPFDYRLELSYRIRANTLLVDAEVFNLSSEKMPHALGWHPFFYATDKKRLALKHFMQSGYDYVAHKDIEAVQLTDLGQAWDHVFHTPARSEFFLENPVDGYKVHCEFDPSHQALVVCSTTDKSVCVEPWCGIPDSANNGRFLQWIDPGKSSRHWIKITAEPMAQ